ncbi:MAG: ABC transporter substrate-binding protein [Ardenticatenaceae bacterium]|nr:ABC transporter substrate-binding protein [Ardenticatenaceae bacterium]HBY93954.1 hypothetical protein [Chloroflexota bacterium]
MRAFPRVLALLLAGTLVLTGCQAAQPAAPRSEGPPQPATSQEKPATSDTSSTKPEEEKTLVISLEREVKNFANTIKYDGGSWFMGTLIFDRLVAMDYGPDFKIHPLLAESWEASPDGKTYTFHLAKNVKWHDGVPFTSADVKYTFDGIEEQKGAALATMEGIESIETPDDSTVVIHTKDVDGSFLAQLAIYPRTEILPKHIYEGTNWAENPANLKPIGTGPYKLAEFVPGSHIILERNDDYFRGKPPYDKIIYKIIPDMNVAIAQLKAGEIDAINNPPPINLQVALDEEPNVAVDMPPGPMVYFLGFNNSKAPFNDVKVRQALAYAIDRPGVTSKVAKGVCQPSQGTYVAAVGWAFNPETRLPDYDPAKAEQMLDEAGYPRGANGTRFPLKLTVSRPLEVSMAEVIKEQLRQIGVDVTVEQLEDATLRSVLQTENKHDAYLYGNWWGPDPAEWETYLRSGEIWATPLNYGNPEVDELFHKGRSSLDRSERAKHYFKIQEIMLRDMPRIPIMDSCPYSFAHTTTYTGWFSEAPVSYRFDVMNMKPAKSAQR